MKPFAALLLSVALPLACPAWADATTEGDTLAAKAALGAQKFAQPSGVGQVSLDFSAVEYYPNLKSKIGVASAFVLQGLKESLAQVEELGPGLMCNDLEFDHWISLSGAKPLPALDEVFSTPGDNSTRPVKTLDKPAPWLWDFTKALGDMGVAQLIQMTGAPAQYQVESAKAPATDPSPTDFAGTAKFIGAWTSAVNHPYPILWSFWNEPGHTLAGVLQGKDVAGNPAFEGESDAAFAQRDATQRSKAAEDTVALYTAYGKEMGPRMGPYARLGIGSLIAADFDPAKPTASGKVFFDEVLGQLTKPGVAPVDFISFNSFNGTFGRQLAGSRGFLADLPDSPAKTAPVIFTQYGPTVLKRSLDGKLLLKGKLAQGLDHQAAVLMLSDLAQMERASDVQHVCLSYWIGGKNGFLSYVQGSLQPRVRYPVLQMFMALPVWRSRIDFGATGLAEAGLHGLAGVNGARASVLLWNESTAALKVPLAIAGLPKGASVDQGRVDVLGPQDDAPRQMGFNGHAVVVPPMGVALLSFDTGAPDPLARRRMLAPARFLGTRSYAERLPAACTDARSQQSGAPCASTSGTYGFYDSVRAVGYLGKGNGSADPKVTATYEALPSPLLLTAKVIGAGKVAVSATYAQCGKSVAADLSKGAAQLDASALPQDCAEGPVTLAISLQGARTGAQAEVYLDQSKATVPESTLALALKPSPDLSVDEGLVLPGQVD